MPTNEQVQDFVTAAKASIDVAVEGIGMNLKDEFQAVYERFQEVLGLPAPPAPGEYISIPVVYVGTQPKGICSLGLFLTIPLAKIEFTAVGGGSSSEVVLLTQSNFEVPSKPRIVGYSSKNRGPGPLTVYTIRAKQESPVLPSEFVWDTVRMATFGVGEGLGTAELIVGADGAIQRIEVKELAA